MSKTNIFWNLCLSFTVVIFYFITIFKDKDNTDLVNKVTELEQKVDKLEYCIDNCSKDSITIINNVYYQQPIKTIKKK